MILMVHMGPFQWVILCNRLMAEISMAQTSGGGTHSYGVTFRFNTVTNICTVLTDFDSTTNEVLRSLGGAFSIVDTTVAAGILTLPNDQLLSVSPVSLTILILL